jgi:hypothetical protein
LYVGVWGAFWVVCRNISGHTGCFCSEAFRCAGGADRRAGQTDRRGGVLPRSSRNHQWVKKNLPLPSSPFKKNTISAAHVSQAHISLNCYDDRSPKIFEVYLHTSEFLRFSTSGPNFLTGRLRRSTEERKM